jgi:hypothetical protein
MGSWRAVDTGCARRGGHCIVHFLWRLEHYPITLDRLATATNRVEVL